MTQSLPTCRFCGLPLSGGRSREHVFPQWLLRHLGAEGRETQPAYYDLGEPRVVDIRRHTFDNFVDGRVCADCNSGWMSRLEEAVSPTLKRLAAAPALGRISAVDRLTLCRWAAKTAYALNAASSFASVRDDHPRHLASSESLPDGVAVFAGAQHDAADLGWVQGSVWRVPRDLANDLFLRHAEAGYKIALSVGRLLLLVAYWPEPTWTYIMGANVHQRIWPDAGSRYYFQSPLVSREESALLLFHWSLGVTVRPKIDGPFDLRGAIPISPSAD